jgi:putative transposase
MMNFLLALYSSLLIKILPLLVVSLLLTFLLVKAKMPKFFYLLIVVEANPGAHPLFHSDGGYQYTSPIFVRMLKDNGMEQSMSRVHCCIDNGPMEGFWGILKCEIYHYGKKYETREELEEAIREWIRYYSHERYQRRFGVRTPYEVRSEALCNENPVQYPIPENKAIQKYKAAHYA